MQIRINDPIIASVVAAVGLHLGLTDALPAAVQVAATVAAASGLMAMADGVVTYRHPPGHKLGRRRWAAMYVPWFVFWWVQLAGLRHAHPLMIFAALAMAAYLAAYPVIYAWGTRRLIRWDPVDNVSLVLVATTVWVATEWARNHFLTGISIGMLGHGAACSPAWNWPAAWGGSYAVSATMMLAGGALWSARTRQWRAVQILMALLLVIVVAGWVRHPGSGLRTGGPTIALVQRNETVDYGQSYGRETAIFDAYYRQTLSSLRETERVVNLVIWPESMMTGGVPWMEIESGGFAMPDETLTEQDLRDAVDERRRYFLRRMDQMQERLAAANQGVRPAMMGGCTVARYDDPPRTYSGVVLVDPSAQSVRWYGKRHLVMFGEYIPLVSHLPIVRDWIPPGLGIAAGDRAEVFEVGSKNFLPTVCIETAVEHFIPGLMSQTSASIDAVVTVTNDGWFDATRVVALHRRAAQMVAVRCQTPILSAGNGGPTMVIDRRGLMIRQLDFDESGMVVVEL